MRKRGGIIEVQKGGDRDVGEIFEKGVDKSGEREYNISVTRKIMCSFSHQRKKNARSDCRDALRAPFFAVYFRRLI